MAWPATRPLNECVNGTRLGAAIVPGQRPHESAAHEDYEENGGHSVHALRGRRPDRRKGGLTTLLNKIQPRYVGPFYVEVGFVCLDALAGRITHSSKLERLIR